jgi:hypothetical protein
MLIFYLEIMLPLFGIKVRIEYNRCSNPTTVGIYLEFHLHVVISRYAIKKFIGDKWFNQNLFLLFSYYFDSSAFTIVSCLV